MPGLSASSAGRSSRRESFARGQACARSRRSVNLVYLLPLDEIRYTDFSGRIKSKKRRSCRFTGDSLQSTNDSRSYVTADTGPHTTFYLIRYQLRAIALRDLTDYCSLLFTGSFFQNVSRIRTTQLQWTRNLLHAHRLARFLSQLQTFLVELRMNGSPHTALKTFP